MILGWPDFFIDDVWLLVSSGDYCEASYTGHVPKVSRFKLVFMMVTAR